MFDLKKCVNVVHKDKELISFTIPLGYEYDVTFGKMRSNDAEMAYWTVKLETLNNTLPRYACVVAVTKKCPLELVVRKGLTELSDHVDSVVQKLTLVSMSLHEGAMAII